MNETVRPQRPVAPVVDHLPEVKADEIMRDNMRRWADKLEREGNRTGDGRMLSQARTVRARWS